jgi:hypothetical protein
MTGAMRAAFATQSRACADLGSPFMARLMQLCADQDWPKGPVTTRLTDWAGDLGPSGQSVPLRLAGALHALRQQGNPMLTAVYPPQDVDDAKLWATISQVVQAEAQSILHWLNHPPQTNEVRRAATLIALGHWLHDRYGLPLICSELGASAGLNLHFDDFALVLHGQQYGPAKPALTLAPDWTGTLPPLARPVIAARGGVDLHPLDPKTGMPRLLAYLWPDQPHRIALTRAAIANASVRVAKGDAIDWLEPRLAHQPGHLHLIYSTIAWQYFPTPRQKTGAAMIRAAGRNARPDTPLAWFGMEADHKGPGAALTLRLWPGDLTFAMGRADFHGRWVQWTPTEVTRKD